MKRVLASVVAFLAPGVLAFAQAPGASANKIGIINIQAAIVGTREGQAAAKDLEGKSAPKKRELEKLQGDINGLREKLNKMSSVGSEDQKQSLMREIDQKTKSFNRQVEDAQAELDQEQGRILNELGGKMLAVLDKYARDNGYTVILDVSAQNTPVLFAATGIDVTQDVIALYDKNAPTSPTSSTGGPGGVAPSGAKPVGAGSPASPSGVGSGIRPGTPAIRPGAPAAPKPGGAK